MRKNFLGLSASLVLSLIVLTSCSNMSFKNQDRAKSSKATKVYTDLGFAYLSKKVYEKSLLNFRKALNYDAKNASAWHGMALIMQEQKQADLAQKYFLKSLELDSSNSEVLNNYGLFLYENKDYKKACEYFKKSLANVFNPKRGFVFINYAHCLVKIDLKKEAEQNFLKAKDLYASKNLAIKSLLKFYTQTKEFDKAKKLIKEESQFGKLDDEIKKIEKSLN